MVSSDQTTASNIVQVGNVCQLVKIVLLNLLIFKIPDLQHLIDTIFSPPLVDINQHDFIISSDLYAGSTQNKNT